MSNTTTTAVHWTFSHFDTWCGATCHTLLRYVLRFLLVLALVGTFTAVFTRGLSPKHRAALRRRIEQQRGVCDDRDDAASRLPQSWTSHLAVDSASSLLGETKLKFAAGMFADTGSGVEKGLVTQFRNGPDVKDSCAVM